MASGLVDIGEEYLADLVVGTSFDVGLFLDATDSIDDDSNLSSITTEPSGNGYSRQSHTVISGDVSKVSGDYAVQFDVSFSSLTFSSTTNVDSAFLVVNFQSDEESDTGAADNLFAVHALSQTRDLSEIDQLDVTVTGKFN